MIARWRTASANGVDQVVAHLTRKYRALGHDVEIWSLHPRYSAVRHRVVEEGLSMTELPCRAAGFILPGATRRFLREQSADYNVAHLHSVFTPANISAAKHLRCPYVLSTHGGYAPFVFRRGAFKKAVFFRMFESAFLRHAAWLHAASEREKQDVLAVAPGQRVVVAPNGVNFAEIPTGNFLAKSPHLGRRLLSLGRLDVEVKGLDLLLAAFASAARPDDRLTFIGPDSRHGQQRLQKMATSLNINTRIHFAGPLFGEEKWRAIAESDAVVQLSRWESMGQTVLEAMAAQRPVLVSQAIHYGDLIAAHECGWVAADGRAAEALDVLLNASDAELANRGRHARQLVAEYFTWDRAAEILLTAYATCLS